MHFNILIGKISYSKGPVYFYLWIVSGHLELVQEFTFTVCLGLLFVSVVQYTAD